MVRGTGPCTLRHTLACRRQSLLKSVSASVWHVPRKISRVVTRRVRARPTSKTPNAESYRTGQPRAVNGEYAQAQAQDVARTGVPPEKACRMHTLGPHRPRGRAGCSTACGKTCGCWVCFSQVSSALLSILLGESKRDSRVDEGRGTCR